MLSHNASPTTRTPINRCILLIWQVPLKVNKLSSTKTLTPYEYYDVPFCRPPKRRGDMENLVRCVGFGVELG